MMGYKATLPPPRLKNREFLTSQQSQAPPYYNHKLLLFAVFYTTFYNLLTIA